MSLPSCFLLVAAFALLASARSPHSPVAVLSSQCWHEYPFSTVQLQSSLDGDSESVASLLSTLYASSGDSAPAPKNVHAPWTHAPVCSGLLESVGSKLCVYTNASFHNGRGISIVTTPQLAEQFAELPAFQEPSALQGINVFSGAWTTREMPGKGMGLVAKKQLKFRDPITAYTPALIAFLEDELPTMDRERLYRIAVYQLPDATRDAYMKLAYVYGQPSVRVQDIVKANTFQLQVGGANHLSVFPETSRVNHACGPNAQYYLDPTRLTHFVHAVRPIAPGEEITIAYTSPLELTDMRQRHLQQGFHFTCSCSRCSANKATDVTLNQIRDMQIALNDWSGASKATPKMAEKMIQLFRKEGLDGFLDTPYGFAALAYNAVGDVKKAIRYAEQAKEIILLKDGPWTPNMQLWNDLLKDPSKHWSYRRRRQS